MEQKITDVREKLQKATEVMARKALEIRLEESEIKRAELEKRINIYSNLLDVFETEVKQCKISENLLLMKLQSRAKQSTT